MKTRTLLTLMAVALLVIPGFSIAAVTGSPELSVHFTDDTVAPGEQTELQLVVLNEGEVDSGSVSNPSLNSEVTKARGLTARVKSGGAPFSVKTGKQAIGTLPQDVSSPTSFQIVVDGDAEPGTYSIPVSVSYTHTSYISEGDGAQDEESVTRTLRTQVTVEDGAELDVVDVSANASVGSTGTAAVTVENTGSMRANETQLTLTSQSGDVTFGESASATRYVGGWAPGEQKTLRYQLTATNSAEAETYPLSLGGTYDEPDGRERQLQNEAFGVDVAPEQSFAVADVSSSLSVGDDGELQGTLTNTGDRTVSDVVLTWASEQRNVNPTESEYAIGSLGPGESAEFDFDVEVSDAARSGPRQFSLVAEYDNDRGDSYTTDPIAVRERVAPASDEFDVQIVDANVSAGGSSTVELRLTNTANETLTDVSAKLFADAPISAADDEAYVDRLEAGDTTSVTFSIGAGAGALEKPYPLSMDFQYDEPDGDTVTSDTYRVPVQVTRSSGNGTPLTVVGGAGLLVLVGVGAFLRFR